MTVLRAIALIASLGALVLTVIEAREPGTFPLATLIRESFRWTTRGGHWIVVAGAGVAMVVMTPLIGMLLGWTHVARSEPISFQWVALAIAGATVKALYVVFEELIFRGALVSQLRRWTNPAVAVVGSALVFAAAHGDRSFVESAILAVDGIGFAMAFVITGSLWAPVIWHLSKNLSVWLFFGRGTIDLTHGPFEIQNAGPEWLVGAGGDAGLLDLIVTVLIVGLATWSLVRHRAGGRPGAPGSASR